MSASRSGTERLNDQSCGARLSLAPFDEGRCPGSDRSLLGSTACDVLWTLRRQCSAFRKPSPQRFHKPFIAFLTFGLRGLTYLPSRLWHIGLGHLGQAYLWGLGLLPYRNPAEVALVLQSIDVVTDSTESTSILSDSTIVGKKRRERWRPGPSGAGLRLQSGSACSPRISSGRRTNRQSRFEARQWCWPASVRPGRV